MPLLARLYERHVETDFRVPARSSFVTGPHQINEGPSSSFSRFSITHCSGCWCLPWRSPNLARLCGGDIFGVDPANAHALSMDFEHDLVAFSRVMAKNLAHDDDEFHRGVVVVQKDHL